MNTDTDASCMPHSATIDSKADKSSKASMPTIYPNDFDYNVSVGFGVNSANSRSFVRSTKNLGQEHRNISVPNSLKVCKYFLAYLFQEQRKKDGKKKKNISEQSGCCGVCVCVLIAFGSIRRQTNTIH